MGCWLSLYPFLLFLSLFACLFLLSTDLKKQIWGALCREQKDYFKDLLLSVVYRSFVFQKPSKVINDSLPYYIHICQNETLFCLEDKSPLKFFTYCSGSQSFLGEALPEKIGSDVSPWIQLSILFSPGLLFLSHFYLCVSGLL